MTPLQATESSSLGALLERARRRLKAAPFHPSTREALLIASHVCGVPEATVLAHPELRLDARQADRFERLLERRLDGEPVAYLLGRREFFGRTFAVDERVLIPRPETEHLVEAALGLPLPAGPRLLDIGTGSGVVALTLALEIPGARVFATDCSPAALAVAADNCRRFAAGDRVSLLGTDLAAGLDLASLDLVVSNPPYVSPTDAESLSEEVSRFEPAQALFAAPDGLGIARRLLADLGAMRSRAWLTMEIGQGQGEAVRELARQSAFRIQQVVPDYAGIERIVVLRHR